MRRLYIAYNYSPAAPKAQKGLVYQQSLTKLWNVFTTSIQQGETLMLDYKSIRARYELAIRDALLPLDVPLHYDNVQEQPIPTEGSID